QLGPVLPEWSEDSFPGILANVIAGRIANRLDLGGANFTVDAACASSLAAVHLAARELESGASDLVLVGGVDTQQGPFAYMAFSKTQALSPRGRCRTFDESADGIVISEESRCSCASAWKTPSGTATGSTPSSRGSALPVMGATKGSPRRAVKA